jgi:F-type H+-transporting ATPase subunit c
MRISCVALLASLAVLLGADVVQAADSGAASFYGNAIAAGLGAGITIVGAGIGFGRIGGAALEGMARQPEAADPIGRNMIVIAALLEGATFFSLIVCIIAVFKG